MAFRRSKGLFRAGVRGLVLPSSLNFTDNFNRANGDPGANWQIHGGVSMPQISGNRLTRNGANNSQANYVNSLTANHFMEFDIVTNNGGDIAGMVGVTPGSSSSYYYAGFDGTNTYYILKYNPTSTTFTQIAFTSSPVSVPQGKRLRAERYGSHIILLLDNTSILSYVDSSLTGQYAGLRIGNTGTELDNFTAGPLTAPTQATLTFTDDFNRASPGVNWVYVGGNNFGGPLSISSNQLTCNNAANGANLVYYGMAPMLNQWAEVDCLQDPTQCQQGVSLRSTDYVNGYFGTYHRVGGGSGTFSIQKRVSNGSTEIVGSTTGPTLAAGFRLRMTIVGFQLTLYYWNGSSWVQVLQGTDGTSAHTQPKRCGIYAVTQPSNPLFDNFACGNM